MTPPKTASGPDIATTNTSSLLSRLAKKVSRATPESELGMRLRHYYVMTFLADRDGIAQHELGDAFMLDANNAVLLLNELETAGYIERRRNPDDRRRHDVFLTDDGRAAVSSAREAVARSEDRVLANLSDRERETLRELLVKALEE